MGNSTGSTAHQEMLQRMKMKRDESFGSKSPRQLNKKTLTEGKETESGREEGEGMPRQRRHQRTNRHNRSHSLEKSVTANVSGTHSPSSSRSSISNSCFISVLGPNCAVSGETENCLRQSTEPMFSISGDLNPHQIGLVRRAWKATLKSVDNEETQIAIRILLLIFRLDPRNLSLFSLNDLPVDELRRHPKFMELVTTFEPTLVHLMGHLTNATTLSKHLQQLGGRHVSCTAVTYKSAYWKSFTQALVEVIMENGGKSAELRDALTALGEFCVEQMKIGYRIEHKLQCAAERWAQKRSPQRQTVN